MEPYDISFYIKDIFEPLHGRNHCQVPITYLFYQKIVFSALKFFISWRSNLYMWGQTSSICTRSVKIWSSEGLLTRKTNNLPLQFFVWFFFQNFVHLFHVYKNMSNHVTKKKPSHASKTAFQTFASGLAVPRTHCDYSSNLVFIDCFQNGFHRSKWPILHLEAKPLCYIFYVG